METIQSILMKKYDLTEIEATMLIKTAIANMKPETAKRFSITEKDISPKEKPQQDD